MSLSERHQAPAFKAPAIRIPQHIRCLYVKLDAFACESHILLSSCPELHSTQWIYPKSFDTEPYVEILDGILIKRSSAGSAALIENVPVEVAFLGKLHISH